jgi:hypothetical protein
MIRMITSSVISWAGRIPRMGVVGKSKKKRQLGRIGIGWMGLRGKGCGGTNWTHLTQGSDKRRALMKQ